MGQHWMDVKAKDMERLLVIDADLAETLSAIIIRARGADGAIPVVPSYDVRERT